MKKLGGNIKSSKMRNILSIVIGGVVGLYFGQYFPDLYFGQLDKYVIDLKSNNNNNNSPNAI